jgi:hypothetical protein
MMYLSKSNTAPARTGLLPIEMKITSTMPPIEWAGRVNHTWFVRGGLKEHAVEWMKHLIAMDDGRLLPSCEAARAMCSLRDPLEDPKPWFYAGLFSRATGNEARRFLDTHRITKAAIPSMRDDENVLLWLDRVGPETRELIQRLRDAIQQATAQ